MFDVMREAVNDKFDKLIQARNYLKDSRIQYDEFVKTRYRLISEMQEILSGYFVHLTKPSEDND